MALGDPAIARALQAMFVGGGNPNYDQRRDYGGDLESDMGPIAAGLGPNANQPLDVGGSPFQNSAQAHIAAILRAVQGLAALHGGGNPNYDRGHLGFVDTDKAPGAQTEIGSQDMIGLPAALEAAGALNDRRFNGNAAAFVGNRNRVPTFF